MPHLHETNEAPYQTNPETISPHRPPQLNEKVCGCRCNYGPSGIYEGSDGEGEGKDEDGASTLVASDGSDTDDDFPPSSDGPEQHVSVETFRSSSPPENGHLDEVQTRFGVFVNGNDGFRLSQHVMGMEEVPIRPHRVQHPQEYDDMAGSMKNEPHGSDDQGVMTPDVRSVRCMSPGPGLGAWAEDFPLNGYHFLARPLRLTPQRQYCRGLVASHMVVRDDMTFMDATGGFLEDFSGATSLHRY